MRRVMLLLAVVTLLSIAQTTFGATYSQLQTLGLVSVKEYGAVGDGVTDDSDEIQAAINYAQSNAKVCFFPPGTYLVSKTLKCYKRQTQKAGTTDEWVSADGYHYKTFYLLGSSRSGSRPVIKLKNSSTGFGVTPGAISTSSEARKSRPVVHMALFCDEDKDGVWDFTDSNGNGIWDASSEGDSYSFPGDTSNGPGEEANRGNAFFFNIRNLDFDLGTGNPSAVAVNITGAQHSGVQDVKVTATGAWGGFYNLTGSQCVNGNIEVVNGRVGIYGSGYPHATSLTGVKLTNQTDFSVYHSGQSLTLVGAEITKASAPAIQMTSGSEVTSDIAFIDAKIDFTTTNGTEAIQNTSCQGLFMANVFVNNASAIVKSGSHASIPGRVGWKKVFQYAVTDSGANGQHIIDGTKTTGQISTVADCNSGDVPVDLRTRHSWNPADFPTPDDIYDRIHTDGDTTCAIITEHGAVSDGDPSSGSDHTGINNQSAIQSLIDSGKKFILVPKGKFLIGKGAGNYGLLLRSDTVLQGIGHNLSEIRTIGTWNPTAEVPVITTVDSATATTKVAFLKVGFQTEDEELAGNSANYSWFTGFDWKAGKNSLTRQFELKAYGPYGNSTDWYKTQARADNAFSGNGGGRHFGLGGSGAPVGCDEGTQSGKNQIGPGLFRRIRATNTTQPLLLYNPNVEDGHDDPQALISGASNVVIYGTKVENAKGWKFLNCSNSALFGLGGEVDLTFSGCSNMLAAIACPLFGGSITEGSVSVSDPQPLGMFKRGTFNWENVTIHVGTDDPAGPPSAPTGLTATADNSNEEIDLNWNDNTQTDLLGYYVYRSTASGGTYVKISDLLSTSQYSDGDPVLTDGATRYYKVSAIDQVGQESSLSSVASANLTTVNHAPAFIDDPFSAPAATEEAAYSQSLLPYVSDIDGDTLTFSKIGTWPTWLSLSTAGVLSGTPPIGAADVSVSVKAEDPDLASDTATMTIVVNDKPVEAVIARATQTPQIDGELDAIWGSATAYPVAIVNSGAVTNDADLSGTYRVMWDDTNLYLLCDATDDALVNDSSTNYYKDDCIEFYFDADNSKNTTYGTDDFKYYFRWHATTPDFGEVKHSATTGVTWSLTTTSTGYLLEASFPWSTLLETPVNGNDVGLEVMFCDDDDGGERDGKKAWWGTGDTASSNPSVFGVGQLSGDTTPPSAPTGLGGTAGDKQVTLNWNDNSEQDLAGYEVYVSPDNTSFMLVSDGLETESTAVVLDLENFFPYYFKVAAVDDAGNASAFSSTISETPVDPGPPVAPSGLAATVSGTQITLDWNDNTDYDLEGYRVYRGTVNGGPYPTLVASVTYSTCTDTNLSPGTYYYVVTAIDEVPYESNNSNQASGTIANPVPAQPTGLTATAGNTLVTLDWDDNTDSDLLNYDVWRSTNAGSDGSVVATVATSEYTDTGLANGTTYYYKVQARDTAQQTSTKSTQVNATPTGGGGDPVVYTFYSTASRDGWVLESGETTNVGGTIDATASTTSAIRIGDNTQKKQYLSILDFNCGPTLPDDAVILSATLKIKRGTSTGTTTGFGSIYADARTYNFNNNQALEAADFEAAATSNQVATMSYPASNGTWSTGSLNAAGIAAISLTYNTQFKVYFATDDDNDTANDYLGFYSGDNATEGNRPVLEVTVQGSGGGDTTPPAVPTGLAATAGNGQVVLDWADNSEGDLADYRVYRSTSAGGTYAVLATVTASTYTDATVTNGVTYYYKVTARDDSSNESALSSYVSATPAAATIFTFNSTNDAYVISDAYASNNYGTQNILRVRGDSGVYQAESYLKFSVSGLSGSVTSAVLKIYSQSGAVDFPLTVHAVSDTSWTEGAITWNNKPAMGTQLDAATVTATETLYELDVTSHITGNGTFSLGLDTTDTDWNYYLHSEESSTSTKRPVLEVTCGGGSSLKSEKGSVSSIGSASWTQVNLTNTYASPVVVCTTNYTETSVPMIVRVRNASGNKFEVTVVNPSRTAVSGKTVQYLVVEEGVYTSGTDGIKMEAKKINSTVTDGYTNGWMGQTVSLTNSYSIPVVLGQVMSNNDTGWSQFWCCSEADYTLPPSNGTLAVGKHIGEDTDLTRSNETLGFIVIEAGGGTMGSMGYVAGRSDDIVRGMDNTPPFAVAISGLSSASNAIVTSNAMEGDNGGWAVGYGTSSWFSSTNLNLACDEDQLVDTERMHATEPVAYIVFE